MPKIIFSYIFDDEFERVYEFFTEVTMDLKTTYKPLLTKLKFYKGEKFDQENAEFSFVWKNYYEVKMIVENIVNEKFFKSITHRSIYIDKLPIQVCLVFNFYRDSVNEKTILIFEIRYQEDFFTDLIKNDFSEEDKLNICKIIEIQLSKSVKKLEVGFSFALTANLDQLRKYILYPKLFFEIISKGMLIILKEEEIEIDKKLELYTKSENSKDIIPLTILIVDSIMISTFYVKIVYCTYKKISFPNISLILEFKELSNKKVFFSFNIKPNEPVNHEININLFKFWNKRMHDFFNFFEKKKINNKEEKNIKTK